MKRDAHSGVVYIESEFEIVPRPTAIDGHWEREAEIQVKLGFLEQSSPKSFPTPDELEPAGGFLPIPEDDAV